MAAETFAMTVAPAGMGIPGEIVKPTGLWLRQRRRAEKAGLRRCQLASVGNTPVRIKKVLETVDSSGDELQITRDVRVTQCFQRLIPASHFVFAEETA